MSTISAFTFELSYMLTIDCPNCRAPRATRLVGTTTTANGVKPTVIDQCAACTQ